MTDSVKQVLESLKTIYGTDRVMYVKGSFAVKESMDKPCQWLSMAQARKITGQKAPEREFRPRVSAWGEWATVAAFNSRTRR